MPNRKPLQQIRISGFSLVELLVVSAILAIGLLGVASLFSQGSFQDSRSYYATQANFILEQLIENSTINQYNENTYKNISNINNNITIDNVNYNFICNITNNTPIANSKEMNCSISWQIFRNSGSIRTTYVFSPKY
jgi:prepilin-type N-terminal cleavage/methylation domain-containing protein